mgnify:CR=1 FL=1
MEYKLPKNFLNNNIKALTIARCILISLATLILLCTITFFLIFFISACIIVPFLFGIPISILKKSIKSKKKLFNGEYKITHETLVAKNFTKLDELLEHERLDDKIANKEQVALRDDNGKIRYTPARVTEFVDANIGDEFFTIYLEGEEKPYAILTK